MHNARSRTDNIHLGKTGPRKGKYTDEEIEIIRNGLLSGTKLSTLKRLLVNRTPSAAEARIDRMRMEMKDLGEL